MHETRSKTNSEHYVWGQACDGWHLLRRQELSVIQERMPPRSFEIRHLHRLSRQYFFVLQGIATLEVDGEILSIPAQEGVEVPPGTPHQMFNQSDADLEFILVSCPPAQGDRVAIGTEVQ